MMAAPLDLDPMTQSTLTKEATQEARQIWPWIGRQELIISSGMLPSDKLALEHTMQIMKLTDHSRIQQLQEDSFTGQQIESTKEERIRDRSELTLKETIPRAMRSQHQLLGNI